MLVENEVKKEDDYCLICRDEKDDKGLIKLSCGHIYHKKCLIQWMKQIKNEVCPMCQQKIDWLKASNLLLVQQ
jgi:E3 ubiquitin-protein ligase DOA10